MNVLSRIPPAKRVLLMSLDEQAKHTHIDKIRVKDIYETAGLSANTFYYHFKDKYDCASLLFKTYEARWQSSFSGDPVNIYSEYVANGAYLERYISEMSEPVSYREFLKQGIELEFERIHEAVAFWRENIHIFKNILLSYAQNSPYYEYREAWVAWYRNMLGPLVNNDKATLDYLSSVLFENHTEFWKLCVLTEDLASIDIDYFSSLNKRIMFSVID